jgi:TPR repeat protein
MSTPSWRSATSTAAVSEPRPIRMRAVAYYRQAAALGSTDAMNLVGLAYMRGEGVAQDPDTGIAWLARRASRAIRTPPSRSGGRSTTAGACEKDLSAALAYFRLSAQRNYLGAYISASATSCGPDRA